MPRWTWYVVIAALAVVVFFMSGVAPTTQCPGSQIHCPGVGCVSGKDKCIPGAKGGPSVTFSREGFDIMKPKSFNLDWPGIGVKSSPPEYGKEGFVNRKCPDGTRTDGPCLMEF